MQSEDYVFPDIHVPASAFRSPRAILVAVWNYGGAFAGGSKGDFDPTKIPLYDGKGPSCTK